MAGSKGSDGMIPKVSSIPMLNKLKIEYHTFFAYYHSLMMASVFNKHDPQSTGLYLKHWVKHTKHWDLAKKYRVKALIHFVDSDSE